MKDNSVLAFLVGVAIGVSAILIYENKEEIKSMIDAFKNPDPAIDSDNEEN